MGVWQLAGHEHLESDLRFTSSNQTPDDGRAKSLL